MTIRDTMEAEIRMLFALCASKSCLAIMQQPPELDWDLEDGSLSAKTDDGVITFSVEVIIGRRGRQEEAKIEYWSLDGAWRIVEEFTIPSEVSEAALALRGEAQK